MVPINPGPGRPRSNVFGFFGILGTLIFDFFIVLNNDQAFLSYKKNQHQLPWLIIIDEILHYVIRLNMEYHLSYGIRADNI